MLTWPIAGVLTKLEEGCKARVKHVLPGDPLGSCAHRRGEEESAYYPGLRLVCFQSTLRVETSITHIRLKSNLGSLKKAGNSDTWYTMDEP